MHQHPPVLEVPYPENNRYLLSTANNETPLLFEIIGDIKIVDILQYRQNVLLNILNNLLWRTAGIFGLLLS